MNLYHNIGEVYIFISVKMYALFLYALPCGYKSANSICVVAMGAMHFSVCVTSVAHTFLFQRYFYE